MKPLLNAALTAALGFALGACTIVADPSSGTSASTGAPTRSKRGVNRRLMKARIAS